MLDDIELDIPEENPPQEPKKGRSSFTTLVAILGGILVLAILAIGAFALFVLPQRQAAEQEDLANQTSTAIVLAAQASDTPTLFPTATNTGEAATEPAATDENFAVTQTVQTLLTLAAEEDTFQNEAPTETPIASNTPEINGATQTVQAVLTQAAEANDAGGGGDDQLAQAMTATSTEDPNGPTQTVESLLTQAAEAQGDSPTDSEASATPTQTATPTATPSSLPDTGFADDINPPTLLLSAALLLIVVLFSRRLRKQLA